ncbi:MAG: hypothetical protein LBR72_08450 [Oscillospiraceae bacterium]|jgi:hypothetical protein|nr:hypothetical protein [Oscillospiraceae bacterium]
MTPERIAELRALCEAATPGTWTLTRREGHAHIIDDIGEICTTNLYEEYPEQDDNFALIAAARTAVPELLDTLKTMTRRAEALERAVRKYGGCGSCKNHMPDTYECRVFGKCAYEFDEERFAEREAKKP